MKRYNLYTLLFLLGIILFASCSDDEFDKKSNVKEGVPTTLTLSLSTSEMQKITTKAALTSDDFNAVYDVYVFVYNKNYELEAKEDFTYSTAVKKGTVTFTKGAITSGVKYIYAVANASKNGLLSTLNGIAEGSDISRLKEITFTLGAQSVQRAEGSLMMSGAFYYSGQTETGCCEVPAPSTENGGVTISNGAIKLDHLDSQITFHIISGSKNINFIPDEWSVYNVPQTSLVVEENADAAYQDLFDLNDMKFESSNTSGGSFVFYMMENRKAAKGSPASVNARESMNGASYSYADADAAYVKISGTYKEYDSNGKLSTYGNVTYTIHLGDFMTDFTNYKSERNKNYTYNITVNGVDDIITEVTAEEDENDGADGHIYRSSNQYVVDAHYGTAVVTFTKNDGYDFLVGVNTPYASEQLYQYGKTDNLSDYDWVMFVRNPDASTDFARYPGTTSTSLLNIKEVIQELKDNARNADFWTNDEVTYTAFINEYYYEDQPWRTFVNKEDRTFSIYTSTKTSYDGKSSYSNPSFRISQRSIKTFYNTNLSESTLPTAWGVEAINEDKTQKAFNGNYAISALSSSKTNGRYNTWYLLTSHGNNSDKLEWSEYVNYSTNTLTSEKDDARYAFLTRNRDLNGDNIINDDEIRWYTCATNQYVGMWIGQAALPTETHLFQGNIADVTETNRYGYHLLSSNNARFWPEEGASTGSESMGSRYFFVRCARNLGGYYRGTPTSSAEPVNYAYTSTKTQGYGKNKKTYTTVNLSMMNPAALRSYTFTTILTNTEHSGGPLNMPYASFTLNYQNTSKTKCPNGYRVPNQRELALMAGFVNDIVGSGLGSCTMSDLKYKADLYYGMASSNNVQYITISSNYTNTRCIKDGNDY